LKGAGSMISIFPFLILNTSISLIKYKHIKY
jgi:hypothetical protein